MGGVPTIGKVRARLFHFLQLLIKLPPPPQDSTKPRPQETAKCFEASKKMKYNELNQILTFSRSRYFPGY